MANETLCWWGFGADNDGGHVPSLAGEIENWGVVFEYGDVGTYCSVFRYGDFQIDIVCGDDVCGSAGPLVISESL
jgi:hypothetical protein